MPTQVPHAHLSGRPAGHSSADLSLLCPQECGQALWAGWPESRSRWWPCTMPTLSLSALRGSRYVDNGRCKDLAPNPSTGQVAHHPERQSPHLRNGHQNPVCLGGVTVKGSSTGVTLLVLIP